MKTFLLIGLVALTFCDVPEEDTTLAFLDDTATLSPLPTPPPAESACWLKAYGRGTGKVANTCPDDQEKNGALCYPKCKKGWSGIGPVCWMDCPADFRDDGAFCLKPKPYVRGTGFTKKDQCENKNKLGCEKKGLVYYPKCAEGFKPFGCCLCTPSCPSGMKDIGISCAKDYKARGVGTLLSCPKGQENIGGLCYPPCTKGLNSVGAVCWANCPADYNKCGALCLKGKPCAGKVKEYFEGVIGIAVSISTGNIGGGIINSANFIKDFIYDMCKDD